MVAAAACYLKSHSQGEYVFDHAWADAYERAGGDYYPKLQVAVPFTPVTGRRLLVAADAPEGAREALIGALGQLRKQTKTSSIHVTFPTVEDTERLSKARLSDPQRRAVPFLLRRLRDLRRFPGRAGVAQAQGDQARAARRLDGDVTIEPLTGSAIRPEHWDAFFKFYMHTGSRKWGRPYLTRAFFDLIGSTLADRVLLVMARRAGRYIAGAINFIGDDALYGRNWGAIEHRPFLHFEVCYYQAIDFALSRGLRRIEAGAPGRAQARARLPADPHLFGARIRRCALGASDRRLSRTRAGSGRAHDRAL